MKLTFLGTGTSYGVPYIGCGCHVCTSDNLRNKRLRSSVLVEEGDTRLLVDTTPDLRQQLLRAKIANLSAIFWTHSHNDHIIGLDDIRPFTDRQGYIAGYGNADTLEHLKGMFGYIFQQERAHGGLPRITPHELSAGQTVEIGPIRVTPLQIFHGQRPIFAYRFENHGKVVIYATDCSGIPRDTAKVIRGADVLVLDGLRHREHPTHFTVEQALAAIEKAQPKRGFLTHIAHDLEHEETNAMLPPGVVLAYDMLEVDV